jgi:polyisoprenoid-binding protein YceI
MRRQLLPALVALACAISAPAFAAHWNVDYTKSRLGFTAQWSGEAFSGTFKRWNADIDFDPADLAHAHVSVTIDLASEASDEPDFDSGLKGAQGFDTLRFPTARFVTKSFTAKSPTSYVTEAVLTIRGISRDITLPFAMTISGRTAHANGTTHVMRTDFGVGQGEWAQPTPVSHDVTVTIDLTATRAGS